MDESINLPVTPGRPRRPATGWSALTPAEVTVARSLVLGLECREIAVETQRSTKTIDTHRGSVLRKVGVDNVAQLIWSAIREGAIEVTIDRVPAWRGVGA